jgi:hypothetical protein
LLPGGFPLWLLDSLLGVLLGSLLGVLLGWPPLGCSAAVWFADAEGSPTSVTPPSIKDTAPAPARTPAARARTKDTTDTIPHFL